MTTAAAPATGYRPLVVTDGVLVGEEESVGEAVASVGGFVVCTGVGEAVAGSGVIVGCCVGAEVWIC